MRARRRRVVFGSNDGKLYSLDAKTGEPNGSFGDNGVVDLNTPEILQGLPGSERPQLAADVYKNS
jgi:quinoprotein glucose dehydrogenase